MKKLFCSMLTAVLLVIAAANLASACWILFYQPELRE